MHNLDHSSYYVGTDGLHFSPYSSLFMWTLMLRYSKKQSVARFIYTHTHSYHSKTNSQGWVNVPHY